MEMRELAEPIAIARTLEARLQRPEPITNVRAGSPDVYVFNPFAEGHIARGKSFTPAKHQAQLARDLANLPQFLGRQDDLVLVPRRPAIRFLGGLQQAGFALPQFVELVDGRIDPAGGLAQRKLGVLRPWAWGPDSVQLLTPLFPSVTGEARKADQWFNERMARLYSKAWSAEFLRSVLAHHLASGRDRFQPVPGSPEDNGDAVTRVPSEAWLCPEAEVGVAVDTLEGALEAIGVIRRRGHLKVVVKKAFGVAGQNSLRLWEPEISEVQRRWLANALRSGSQLVVEPWLERAVDFSVQLEMEPHGLQLRGYTGLRNDLKGQFQANWAEPHHHLRLPTRVVAAFREPAAVASRIHQLYADIIARLEVELRAADYVGPVGIDALVYRTPDGGCRLKPVVEINPRYTMGRLTVELMKQTCPGSSGVFRLVNRALAQAEGFADFAGYARALAGRFPLCLEGEAVPRVREGAVCLNDPTEAQACLATFRVSRRLDTLLAPLGVISA